MGKSGFEKFMEKAGIFVSEQNEGTESNGTIQMPGEVPRNNGHDADVFNPTMQDVSTSTALGDVIAEAYSTLPKSEDDIVVIVEKLLQNFEMLPAETKPTVVRSTLETMGKDIGKFLMEADTKKNALANAIARYAQNTSDEITKLEAIIAEAEAEISRCKQEQLNKKNELEKQKAAVAEEAKRLEKIIGILGGN